jgi:protein-tyrosine phosphatase
LPSKQASRKKSPDCFFIRPSQAAGNEDMAKAMTKILFVCMGNICRSPSAEAVFRRLAKDAGLGDVFADSAGTHGYHVGCSPDERAAAAAAKRGYDLSGMRARLVAADDFAGFDLILAMDNANLRNLRALAGGDAAAQLRLFLQYAPNARGGLEVPDPYYGGDDGFERVLDMLEDASRGLIEFLSRKQ